MKGIRWFFKGALACCTFAVVTVHAGAGDAQNGYPNNLERSTQGRLPEFGYWGKHRHYSKVGFFSSKGLAFR